MKAVVVSRHGGPEVLDLLDIDAPVPGAGQALVEVAAAGVNFMDTYARAGAGAYARQLPFILGAEGSGRVLALGDSVGDVSVGDRVVWKAAPGSYAQRVLVPAAELVPIPDGLSNEAAAAVFLQGLTAHYLVHSTHTVQAGDTVVVHAAAGGVGLLLTQMAARLGARVVGTVSNADKERRAREAGATEVVRYDQASVAEVVRHITAGEGADVVYDGVGAATFEESLRCLRPRGLLALYGAASGPVPPFDLQRLNSAGSLFVTRPTLVHYTRDRAELVNRASAVLKLVATGELTVHIGGRYPLAAAQQAHRDLESRRTMGKLLLVP